MAFKSILWLALLALLAGMLAAGLAPAPALAFGRTAPALTPTPLPIVPAKVGSNAHLAIGALVLVLIILFGVALNLRRKK